MQERSLAEIRADIAARADLPTLSASTFITQAEMDQWINQSGRRLVQLLVDAYGEGHFATTQTISTTADQDYSALPASATGVSTDIFRVLGLRVTLDGTRVDLKRATAAQIDMEGDNDDSAWTRGRPPRWAFREHLDQRFLWSRTPAEVHTVTIHYVPYFVFITHVSEPGMVGEMTATAHKVRSHMGWDEWLVLDCAIKALKRQGLTEDWQALALEQKDLQQSIVSGAQKRTSAPLRTQKRFRNRARRGRLHA